MAILTGINTRLRGSIGNYTFQRVNGQTIAKEKVEKKAVPTRSLAQMLRRMQWANLVNLYRSFDGTLHPSFEGKDPRKSDFNMFMHANLGKNPVYLTKEQASMRGAVVASYMVTMGSLSPINVEFGNNDIPECDIALGSLTLGNSTTLKAFSDAVVQNNSDWRSGDQLSVYIARQMVDAGLKGQTVVSTQSFVVNNSYLASYQTAAAFNSAVKSYGGVDSDQFLTPNLDDVVAIDVNP